MVHALVGLVRVFSTTFYFRFHEDLKNERIMTTKFTRTVALGSRYSSIESDVSLFAI